MDTARAPSPRRLASRWLEDRENLPRSRLIHPLGQATEGDRHVPHRPGDAGGLHWSPAGLFVAGLPARRAVLRLLNHHTAHPEQRYAADTIAINQLGYRAAGLSPKALDRYVIYGMSVVSPCAGKVVGTRSDLPDLIPPDSDPEPPSPAATMSSSIAAASTLSSLISGKAA